MSRILVLYSTVDGQTLKICGRLREIAEETGHRVILAEVQHAVAFDAALFDTVVVGASIRYGKHRPDVVRYMRSNRPVLEARRCAFFSVNIVARKAQKNTPHTNPYMRSFLKKIGWRPKQLGVFAGKLDYPRYGFWDRNIIRFIMLLTGGPTDPAAVVEFTDWDRVEAFGRSICDK